MKRLAFASLGIWNDPRAILSNFFEMILEY